MFKTSTKQQQQKKTRERTTLRTYTIQISFCQFQWFTVHKKKKRKKKKSSKQVLTFTKFQP